MPRNTETTTTSDPARAMWCAVLESWAADCLELRARGLDRPSTHSGADAPGRAFTARRPAACDPAAEAQRPLWRAA